MRRPKWAAVAVLVALSAGCGSAAPAEDTAAPGSGTNRPATVLKPATLRAGQPVPLPAGCILESDTVARPPAAAP